MKKENIKRKPKAYCRLGIGISKHMSQWLKKEDISPTALFKEACKDQGYKENAKFNN